MIIIMIIKVTCSASTLTDLIVTTSLKDFTEKGVLRRHFCSSCARPLFRT